jgi:hypothetical protein
MSESKGQDRKKIGSLRTRLAREEASVRVVTGTRAAFAADREKAEREARASVNASGSDYDPELEAAGGRVPGLDAGETAPREAFYGMAIRAWLWSVREGRGFWWRYDTLRRKWTAEGVDDILRWKLRVELSDANDGRSAEEVLADRLREASA